MNDARSVASLTRLVDIGVKTSWPSPIVLNRLPKLPAAAITVAFVAPSSLGARAAKSKTVSANWPNTIFDLLTCSPKLTASSNPAHQCPGL